MIADHAHEYELEDGGKGGSTLGFGADPTMAFSWPRVIESSCSFCMRVSEYLVGGTQRLDAQK